MTEQEITAVIAFAGLGVLCLLIGYAVGHLRGRDLADRSWRQHMRSFEACLRLQITFEVCDTYGIEEPPLVLVPVEETRLPFEVIDGGRDDAA